MFSLLATGTQKHLLSDDAMIKLSAVSEDIVRVFMQVRVAGLKRPTLRSWLRSGDSLSRASIAHMSYTTCKSSNKKVCVTSAGLKNRSGPLDVRQQEGHRPDAGLSSLTDLTGLICVPPAAGTCDTFDINPSQTNKFVEMLQHTTTPVTSSRVAAQRVGAARIARRIRPVRVEASLR